ncbi:OmpA family protein [Dyadobacter sp. CY261]|uniref:OmpA family protein n=1 Tax=Dyadobacter sp. CY261 TaxID=2907203 RepID=UPI001F2FFBBE|nr:OmpA family protein [Dyadobacter sp. CY261]MCF0075077.1 OmpA family protein [Dyadobacter sp. CY261]
MLILSFLLIRMSDASGQCFTFNGKIINAASGQPISANLSIKTESTKQVIGKSNDQGVFSLQAPCNLTSLLVEKAGFRTMAMPVTGKDGSYYFELGLFPVDKQTNDRPYFQSEQQDLILDNSDSSKTEKRITRLFKLVDVVSKKPIKGEVCLYYTKTGNKTCFSADPDLTSQNNKITFTREDIIGLVATAGGYQAYNGNLIIDRLDNSSSVYEVAMSKQLSIVAVSIEPANSKNNYKTELFTDKGQKLSLKMADVLRGYSIVNSGEAHRIRITSGGSGSKPISLTLPPSNGIQFVKVDLPKNQVIIQKETPPASQQEPTHSENITLAPLDQRIIYFDQSSYELRPSSRQTLDSLATWLLQNPEYRIEITGHTDNIGDGNRNLILSEYRSKVTANYLINHGAGRKQVHWQARGGQKPAFPNDEEKTKALNRRVELKILR